MFSRKGKIEERCSVFFVFEKIDIFRESLFTRFSPEEDYIFHKLFTQVITPFFLIPFPFSFCLPFLFIHFFFTLPIPTRLEATQVHPTPPLFLHYHSFFTIKA